MRKKRTSLRAMVLSGIAATSMICATNCYDFAYDPGGNKGPGPGPDGSNGGDLDASRADVQQGGGDDASDARPDTPSNPCPSNRGPTQVQVKTPNGSFCIDSTEVTRGQYADFLAANPDPPTGQIQACTWNKAFVPAVLWPDGQGRTAKHPISGVDWCDAYAYCKWAGKSLCGALKGGTDPLPDDPVTQAEDRWRIACSHAGDGLHNYPYGNQYSAATCNGLGQAKGISDPVGTSPGCVGGYPGIFDMSGNVGEWTDSCGKAAEGEPPNRDPCSLRGGSWRQPEEQMRCTDRFSNPREDIFDDVGIRCCR